MTVRTRGWSEKLKSEEKEKERIKSRSHFSFRSVFFIDAHIFYSTETVHLHWELICFFLCLNAYTLDVVPSDFHFTAPPSSFCTHWTNKNVFNYFCYCRKQIPIGLRTIVAVATHTHMHTPNINLWLIFIISSKMQLICRCQCDLNI